MSRVVVIGSGLAGLVAANRLAASGAKVTLLSKGLGGLQLGQGTIDVFGYNPQRVTNPIMAVAAVAEGSTTAPGEVAPPAHPYTVIGPQTVLSSLSYLKELLPELLVGDPEANYQLPTAVGAIRPTCLAQPSMIAGQVRADAQLVIVGLRQLKDFHPQLVAENLARTPLPDGGRLSARHVILDFPARDGEIDSSGLTYARSFDDPAFRDRFAKTLSGVVEPGEIIGLPAILGLRDFNAWRSLAEAVGHPIFEIPLAPPSVPGIRLNEALTAQAITAGVRIVPGVRTISFTADGGRVTSVSIDTAPAAREFVADAFVLATGGFESGALSLDSHGEVSETLFGLPLAGLDAPALLHGDYWGAEQPLFKVGVRVGKDLRPLDASGAPVYANLYAAGGIIAGSPGWAEKSGDGVALASAVAAADSITKELA
jgi:glycerol-3-phosphate dehydrogenase subunit B